MQKSKKSSNTFPKRKSTKKKDNDCKEISRMLTSYKCIKILGKGGFGSTYLMEDLNGKKVAIKAVYNANKNEIKNEDEILDKLAFNCSSKRVLCYDTYFRIGDYTYFITEYIEGTSLNNYKFKNPKLVYKIFNQIIEAVEYIHSLDIVHFDIKPHNIMITKTDDVKLIDFGGSSIKSKIGLVSANAYTPYYAPKSKFLTMPIKKGIYFDWFTVITTLIDILQHVDNLSPDLLAFKNLDKEDLDFGPGILKTVNDLKKVIEIEIKKPKINFLTKIFKPKTK